MRRTICYAFLAFVVSSGVVFGQTHRAPRPRVRVIVVHRFHGPCFFPSVAPAPFLFPMPYASQYSVSNYPVPEFVLPSPSYLFIGSAWPARPQLVFKDGTTYAVSDYWKADDLLHFITVEEGGTKSVPHNVPFDSLDLQRTKEAAAVQGFRFVIRDEPIEQWLEHRAQHERGPRRTGKSGKS
jgi:hypothetical protein